MLIGKFDAECVYGSYHLTPCPLSMSYSDIDLGYNGLRLWLVTLQDTAIIPTYDEKNYLTMTHEMQFSDTV